MRGVRKRVHKRIQNIHRMIKLSDTGSTHQDRPPPPLAMQEELVPMPPPKAEVDEANEPPEIS